jgi:Holliday junction resolvasome RuvABC endonuclease subunit
VTIIAFDCATKTGWAIIRDGKVFESGVQDFAKRRGESNGLMFLRFRNWLDDLLRVTGHVAVLAYELAHYRGGAASEVCGNLTGRVQEAAAQWKCECAGVQSTSLKKWATGSGKADKVVMIAKATQLMGKVPLDDNEADAVLIGLWAWEQYGVRPTASSLPGMPG